MKKCSMRITLIVLSLVTCMAFMTGCNGDSQSETVTLKLAHFWPSSHFIETDLIQPWAQEIADATDGRVIIDSYPGELLLKASDVYDGVVKGSADIGVSCFSYSPGRFPFCEVFELPGITYETSKSAGMVAWEVIQEYDPVEIHDTNVMMVFSTGPGDIYSKQPVRSLDDMKGLEVRATGISTRTLSELGAAPVNLSQAEAYDAISKGVVKANLGPAEVLKSWNQADITSYVTKTPFLYNTLFFLTFNSNKWQSLDEETQEIISEITQRYFSDVAISLWDNQNGEAMAWATDEKGMEVIELSAAEAERWRRALIPVQNDWVKVIESKENVTESNGIDGSAVLKRVQELADLYNKL